MKTQKKPLPIVTETDPIILQSMLVQSLQQIEHLREQLEWLQRQVFGKKTERVVGDIAKQPDLFDGFGLKQSESPAEPVPPPTPKARRKPVRNGTDTLTIPPNTRVETIVIDIPEEQKICKITGLPLVKIGEEHTYKLAHKPGEYFISMSLV